MAESYEENDVPGCETQDALKSRKLLYEKLAKEDLIKLAKKHLALLQKVKNKCDVLSEECTQYKDELVSAKEAADRGKETESKVKELYRKIFPSDFVKTGKISTIHCMGVIEKELLELKEKESKIFRLEEELNNAVEDRERISVSFRAAEEEIHCMKLKLDTLMATCQCLQEDLTKCQELNKGLNDEVNAITAARDTAPQSVSSVKMNKNGSLELEKLKTELEQYIENESNLKKELMIYQELNSNLQLELNALIKTKTALENKNISLAEKCRFFIERNDCLMLQLEKYEIEKVNFTSCTEKLAVVDQENEDYKAKNEDLKKHMNELEEENLRLNKKFNNEESLLNDLNCQIEILVSCIKQGVKQKNFSNKIKAQNEPMQNISTLRTLYDEISSQLKNHVIQVNFLENELKSTMQQKQKSEDELFQLMDLKLFLEDETKSLLEENEQLKHILNNSLTHSGKGNEIISQLERELQISTQGEQEPLNELHNCTVCTQEPVSPLVECEISSISPKNIPETIREELDEEEATPSGIIKINGDIVQNCETSDLKLCHTCDASTQINLSRSFHDISVQTGEFLIDASTEVSAWVEEDASHNLVPNFYGSLNSPPFSTALTEKHIHEITSSPEVKLAGINLAPQEIMVEKLCRTQGVAAAHNENQFSTPELQNKSKVIEYLKKALEEKSKLVESIHCQMDSLLTKVEELNEEIKIKDLDLDAASKKIRSLESELKHLHNLQESNRNSLVVVNDIVAVLRNSKDNIIIDMNKLHKDCMNMFCNTNDVVSSLHSELSNFYSSIESHEQERIALEGEICNFKESITEIDQELLTLLEILKNTFSEKYLVGESCLVEEKPFVEQQEIYDGISGLTFKHISKTSVNNTASDVVECSMALCSAQAEKQKVIRRIKLLSKEFQKAVDFIDQLSMNSNKSAQEVNNCRSQVIPNLENTVSDLCLKLKERHEGSDERSSRLDSYQTTVNEMDSMQNVSEETLSCLQKQVADAEMKVSKFKIVAIKVKKELAETKKLYQEVFSERDELAKRVSDMSSALNEFSTVNHQQMRNFQSLQGEYDKLQDEYEELKTIAKALEGDLATSVAELNGYKQKYLSLDAECEKLKGFLCELSVEKQTEEKKTAELENKVVILETDCGEKQKMIDDLDSELSKSKNSVTEIKSNYELVKQKLEEALKERKKNSLLDLEMADYERTITELNLHLRKKCEEILELQCDVEGLNSRISCLEEEIAHCESQRITEEKRADGLKEVLEKTKEELVSVRNHEQELRIVVTVLQHQMESSTQQKEEYKVQLARVSEKAEVLKESLNVSAENHQKTVRSLETKIHSLHEEISVAHKDVKSVREEFENYKIRVHSVLKQQKHCSGFAPNDAEIKEELQKLNEQLKLQVTDLSEKLRLCILENESLHKDHDHLLLRYGRMVEELEAKNQSWSLKLEQVISDKKGLEAAQEELVSQHAFQHSMLTTSFLKQIKDLQEKHKHELKEMQKKLDDADIEIAHLHSEKNTSGIPSTPLAQDDPFAFDFCSQERQEGEGSECTEGRCTPVKPMSLTTIPTSGFLPLEKLLQSPMEPETPKSFISNRDSEKLICDLSSAYKKIDHLNELLNESEANNLRLNEQVRMLKEEVRRLERNKEREQHAENMEYLKNIFVKFITLQSGDEKMRLLPVLTTMLKLSPLEQQQLRSVAGASSETDASSGWGTYFHRWSGLI